jgi:uncharacterized protein
VASLELVKLALSKKVYTSKKGEKLSATNSPNIDACDKYGMTALLYATFFGQIDTVKILIEQGADVNKMNSEGLTPLRLAAKQEIKVLFIANGAVEKKSNFDDERPFDN